MKRYIISPGALADLDDVWDHIAEENPMAADRLMESLYERFRLLGTQPLMGEARPDLALDVRHSPLGNYLILYRPREEGIEVLRVVHGARDIPAVFRKRR